MTKGRAARLGAAAASGALLALARPPVDVGLLAVVALVPLFWTWRDATPRAAIGYSFLAGAVYYGLLVSWVWYFGAVAIVPLVAVLAAYWAAVAGVVAWLRRYGLRSPLLVAAVWVVGEAAVARVPLGGFSWGEVGYALHDQSAGRAIASWGGVALVSFVVVATNAFLADLLFRGRPARRDVLAAIAGLVVVALFVPGVATATWMHPHDVGTFHVAMLQGNDKNRPLTQTEEDERYIPQRHFELAKRLHGRYDLVVFPESSMDDDPRHDAYLQHNLTAVARRLHTYVLTNAVTDAPPDGKRAENLDLLYDPRGRLVGTYAKRHLVPYGEEVPFRGVLQPLIKALDQVPRDFVRGKRPGLFDVRGHRFATIICFESAFGYQVRPLVRDGAQMIVVSTNNRSYRRSANSTQHVDLSQMRAAETGRPVLHASISGITAVIDARGNVSHTTKLFVPSVVSTNVTLTSGQTPYVRWGEWVVLGSLAATLVAVGVGLARRRRRSVDSTAVPDLPAIDHDAAGVDARRAERV